MFGRRSHGEFCECDDCRLPVLVEDPERVTIEEWRKRELVQAGYAEADADEIAADFSIDLHQAIRLVTELDCPVDLAVRIVL